MVGGKERGKLLNIKEGFFTSEQAEGMGSTASPGQLPGPVLLCAQCHNTLDSGMGIAKWDGQTLHRTEVQILNETMHANGQDDGRIPDVPCFSLWIIHSL